MHLKGEHRAPVGEPPSFSTGYYQNALNILDQSGGPVFSDLVGGVQLITVQQQGAVPRSASRSRSRARFSTSFGLVGMEYTGNTFNSSPTIPQAADVTSRL